MMWPELLPYVNSVLLSVDQVLEKAMVKCVLKPLKPVLSVALHEFQVHSGMWQELKDKLSLYKARQPQELGVADTLPPDSVAIDKIKAKFQVMYKQYNPEKKVTTLLRICKLIYTIMEDNSGSNLTRTSCFYSVLNEIWCWWLMKLNLRGWPCPCYRSFVRCWWILAHADLCVGPVWHASARQRNPLHDGAVGPIAASRRRLKLHHKFFLLWSKSTNLVIAKIIDSDDRYIYVCRWLLPDQCLRSHVVD